LKVRCQKSIGLTSGGR